MAEREKPQRRFNARQAVVMAIAIALLVWQAVFAYLSGRDWFDVMEPTLTAAVAVFGGLLIYRDGVHEGRRLERENRTGANHE